jgi:hypothetical protein
VTRHAYPGSAMIGDYARAGAGVFATGAVLACGQLGPVATGLLAGLLVLFAVFGLRTGLRHATQIEASENGLSASGLLSATIRWAELDRIKLAYYSTRRDRSSGWMQLDLAAGAAAIRLDSRLDGFNQLVERSALAAAARGIAMSPATAANLQALGIKSSALQELPSGAEGRA